MKKEAEARRWLTGATNSLAAAAVVGCESNITIATHAQYLTNDSGNYGILLRAIKGMVLFLFVADDGDDYVQAAMWSADVWLWC